MAQEKSAWANLDSIWISHFLLTVGGLAPVFVRTKHAPDTQSAKKPMKIFGAKGLPNLGKLLTKRANTIFQTPFPVEIPEVERSKS